MSSADLAKLAKRAGPRDNFNDYPTPGPLPGKQVRRVLNNEFDKTAYGYRLGQIWLLDEPAIITAFNGSSPDPNSEVLVGCWASYHQVRNDITLPLNSIPGNTQPTVLYAPTLCPPNNAPYEICTTYRRAAASVADPNPPQRNFVGFWNHAADPTLGDPNNKFVEAFNIYFDGDNWQYFLDNYCTTIDDSDSYYYYVQIYLWKYPNGDYKWQYYLPSFGIDGTTINFTTDVVRYGSQGAMPENNQAQPNMAEGWSMWEYYHITQCDAYQLPAISMKFGNFMGALDDNLADYVFSYDFGLTNCTSPPVSGSRTDMMTWWGGKSFDWTVTK